MGSCLSCSADKRLDNQITKEVRKVYRKEEEKIKLLLLGAGESGKSTIFKQMRILYGRGFSEENRREAIPTIHWNVIFNLSCLLSGCEKLGIPVVSCLDALDTFQNYPNNQAITPEVAEVIRAVYQDPGVQKALSMRSKFQLNDSAEYFFERLSELAKPDYLPSVDDILQMRIRTTGIVHESFMVDGVEFEMYDVGGQRSERRKWIHCFDNVTAVIFVAAISEYDQCMAEDPEENRLMDALKLFEEICRSRWFEQASIILFLNKEDIFRSKIETVDIRQPHPSGEGLLFGDYLGGKNYKAGREYFVRKFLTAARKHNKDRGVFYDLTTATNTENINTVFNACKQTILRTNLVEAGFL